MIHAFRLIEATGLVEEGSRLWGAVYLHDIARTHDGVCFRHGGDAMRKFEARPDIRALFAEGGVKDGDYEAIHTAVVHHCIPKELDRAHPHWRLASLLKDADGLDRVRLGDLDARYLRHSQSREMVRFAEALFDTTDRRIAVGPDHFAAIWPAAARLQHAS